MKPTNPNTNKNATEATIFLDITTMNYKKHRHEKIDTSILRFKIMMKYDMTKKEAQKVLLEWITSK